MLCWVACLCVVAFCFGFRAYLLPCFAKVLLAIVDVNCRALGHFEMCASFYICVVVYS